MFGRAKREEVMAATTTRDMKSLVAINPVTLQVDGRSVLMESIRLLEVAGKKPSDFPTAGGEDFLGWPVDVLCALAQTAENQTAATAEVSNMRAANKGANVAQAPMRGRGMRHSPDEMLAMRMGWNGRKLPATFLRCEPVLTETKAYVFVITAAREEAFVIEDDYGLFPSDTLITKLRMFT